MPVLMRDVARRAGVSITTVSHVINQTRPVAEKTRARVLRSIDSLSYYKNSSARLLVRGQSELLGLIISDIENPFFPELIKSFEQECAANGLEVLLCATNYDPRQAENALRRMLESRVQGVAVMTSQIPSSFVSQLTAKNVPLVLLGTGATQNNRSHIAIDYSRGLLDAVRHLLELGHSRIAIAAGPQNQVSAIEYRQAIEKALRRMGLKPFAVVEGDHRPESGAWAARELLTAAARPSAIICANDRMAIGAVGAAEDMGLHVPADVSIIGSDDVWMSRYTHPPLTTVRIPRDTLGQMAFEVLTGMLRSQRRPGVQKSLKTELVIRRSTGPASAQAAGCGTKQKINSAGAAASGEFVVREFRKESE